MFEKKKKGLGMDFLVSAGISFIVLVVVLGVGSLILMNFRSSVNATSDPNTTDVLNLGIQGITTLAEQNPTIAIVLVGAFLLGLLLTVFPSGRSA